MKKIFFALLFLITLAIGASSCFVKKKKPCPAYYSSSQNTQINYNQNNIAK